MGMFGKSMNVEQEMKKVDSEAISSIIDKSMTIKGEIFFKGKARIDGTINGNIDGEHLILSETGKVIGDITVSSFNCYGSLEGNIKANHAHGQEKLLDQREASSGKSDCRTRCIHRGRN